MNIKNLSYSFFGSFNSTHVILYVGQNATDDDLQKYIAKCPWSCVITSRCDPEFAAFFSDKDRTPFEYSFRTEIPAKPLNRKRLPIIRLFGIEGQEYEEDLSWLKSDLSEDASANYDMTRAKDFLQLLPELLDHVNPLVVVGMDSDADWRLFSDVLNKLLYKQVTDGSVSFWGVPETVEQKYAKTLSVLRTVCEKKEFPPLFPATGGGHSGAGSR